jgi:hypothetical protein
MARMKWLFLPILVSAILLSVASASALSPTPLAQTQGGEVSNLPNNKATSDKSPSEQPTTSTDSEIGTSESKRETQSHAEPASPIAPTIIVHVDSHDRAIAAASIILAGAAIVQLFLLCATLKANQLNAVAAEQNARATEAALHVNRPFLLVTDVKFVDVNRDGRADELLYIYEFDVCLRNFGVGPADIVDYIAGAAVQNRSIRVQPIVEPRPWYAPTGLRLSQSLVAPGEWVEGRIKEKAILTRALCDKVRNDEAGIAIDGIIRYRGASKQVYWTRFFWWCFLDAGDNPINIQRALRSDLNDHN